MKDRYQAPIVKKAFHILRFISRHDGGVRLSDLARELSIGKSTVHGIMSALEEVGAVRKDPTSKRFNLGITLLELGGAAYTLVELKDVARAHMQTLMEECQESVFLGVANGDHVTIVDIVESARELKITSPIGTTLPLLAGATGKVFMALMKDAQVEEFLRTCPMPLYTPNSVRDVDNWLKAVRNARTHGFATDDEEYIRGVRAVAAQIPINGHQMAAIWVVGFKASLEDAKIERLTELTRNAARKIGESFMNLRS